MKPPPFAYMRADSLPDAVAFLAEYGEDAKVLAGGQSLIPMLNYRLVRPSVLVDITPVRGLDDISTDDGIRIGATVTQHRAEHDAELRALCPLLATALSHVGHMQIRHQGTIGGSLAHADPSAELPAVAMALRAELVVEGPAGRRTLPAEEFFVGPYSTQLGPDEVLVELSVESSGLGRTAFGEVSRRHGDFALAGVAAAEINGYVSLVAFGMGWAPTRLKDAEKALAELGLSDRGLAEAGEAARDEVTPIGDIHADKEYRREAVQTLLLRNLRGWLP